MNNAVAQSALARQIADAVQSLVGPGPVALHEPRFVGNEWTYLKECLDSIFVSSVGKFVDCFEADLAAYTGAKHAVAVWSMAPQPCRGPAPGRCTAGR